jgi:lipoate-protein ligase A
MNPEPSFSPSSWRLLITPPAPGDWNMAVDEAILESVGRLESPPTLRLYAWQPPCLSLGYAQPTSDVDLPRLQAHGWHLVRRPTGGRAILHTDELTYSVAAPHGEPRLAGSLLDSYRRLSTALLATLHLLGVPAESHIVPPSTDKRTPDPVCFEVPSNYEITMAGKKLVGSAQARRKDGILQHGTLPLSGDLARITQVLAFPDEAARLSAAQRLHTRAATLEEILGYPVPWEHAAQAFITAFQQTLNLELLSSGLTPQEQARAAQLSTDKYASLSVSQ